MPFPAGSNQETGSVRGWLSVFSATARTVHARSEASNRVLALRIEALVDMPEQVPRVCQKTALIRPFPIHPRIASSLSPSISDASPVVISRGPVPRTVGRRRSQASKSLSRSACGPNQSRDQQLTSRHPPTPVNDVAACAGEPHARLDAPAGGHPRPVGNVGWSRTRPATLRSIRACARDPTPNVNPQATAQDHQRFRLSRGCRVINVSSGVFWTIPGWLRLLLVVIVSSRF